MRPEFYQDLLDRYWRRSGSLLYRPNQRQSCCPHYTIRLDSTLFKPSRDHRQTLNRFNKHVVGSDYVAEAARIHPRPHHQPKKRHTEFDLIERIHESEHANLKTPPEPAHRFSVTLEDDSLTEEKYRVYENYQRVVHKEGPSDISRKGFKRFLCDSPILRKTITTPEGKEQKLGSYHMCYWLDGQLVGIGVLDLLPHCVSSVYFLYHESIHGFSPGKLSALREIALAREGGYRYWYPGFYIHSCPKMRYKTEYQPQYILDPETLEWDPLDRKILSLLDMKPYVSYSGETSKNATGEEALNAAKQKHASSDVNMETGEDEPGPDSSDEEDMSILFGSDMPGIPTLSDLRAVDMDRISLKIDGSGMIYKTSDLVVWSTQELSLEGGLKTKVAELVAAVGPDLMESMCLDFSR